MKEKAPYLVTIFFASLGWVLTYSVDRMDKSPTVTFQSVVQVQGGKNIFRVSLQNITRDKVFSGVKFVFLLKGDQDAFVNAWIDPVPPAWEGSIRPQTAGNSATFQIAQFEPGWKLDLCTEYNGAHAPTFHLEESGQTIRLAEPSIETIFVRHEFRVMGIILACYVVALGVLFFLTKKQSNADPAKFDVTNHFSGPLEVDIKCPTDETKVFP